MIKIVLIILITFFSSNIFAEEVVMYLKEQVNYDINEAVDEYIVSSPSVTVVKENNKLIVRNISLSSTTSVYLNLFLSNGSIKTYVFKKEVSTKATSNDFYKKNKNLFFKNSFAIDSNQDNKTEYRMSNEIYHKYKNSLFQIKGQYRDSNINRQYDHQYILSQYKLGYYDNFLEYKKRSILGNSLSSYKIEEHYKYNMEYNESGISYDTGRLLNSQNLDKGTAFLNFKNYKMNFNIMENQSSFNKDYNFMGIATFKNDRLYFSYNINDDKIEDNYFHKYNFSYLKQLNMGGNFKIDNFSINHYNNDYDHFQLDGLSVPQKKHSAAQLNSSYKQLSISNYYSRLNQIYQVDNYNNRLTYNSVKYSFNYTFESNYSISKNKATHNINHYFNKGFGDYIYNVSYLTSENDQTLSNNLKYYNNDFYYTIGYNISKSDNSLLYDKLVLSFGYSIDKWSFSDWIYYSNFLYNRDSSIISNQIDINYNYSRQTYIHSYLKYIKYENISKPNYQAGVGLTYNYGTNIDYSFLNKKYDDKILTICHDENYNFICEENEYLANRKVILNHFSFSEVTTDELGSIEYNKTDKISDISFDIDDKTLIFTKAVDNGKQWSFIYQRLYPKKIVVKDNLESNPINDINAKISCENGAYSKSIIIYNESIYNLPHLKCSLIIESINNLKLNLEQDYRFDLNENENSLFTISPLKRKTLYFYEDKNLNNTIDIGESLELSVNKKKKTSELIINNYSIKEKLEIDKKYRCNIYIDNHKNPFFNDYYNIPCVKKSKKP